MTNSPVPTCLKCIMHAARLAVSFAFLSAGSSSAARIEMIATTTSNSIRVKEKRLDARRSTFDVRWNERPLQGGLRWTRGRGSTVKSEFVIVMPQRRLPTFEGITNLSQPSNQMQARGMKAGFRFFRGRRTGPADRHPPLNAFPPRPTDRTRPVPPPPWRTPPSSAPP